jgi:hypothetical protein
MNVHSRLPHKPKLLHSKRYSRNLVEDPRPAFNYSMRRKIVQGLDSKNAKDDVTHLRKKKDRLSVAG